MVFVLLIGVRHLLGSGRRTLAGARSARVGSKPLRELEDVSTDGSQVDLHPGSIPAFPWNYYTWPGIDVAYGFIRR